MRLRRLCGGVAAFAVRSLCAEVPAAAGAADLRQRLRVTRCLRELAPSFFAWHLHSCFREGCRTAWLSCSGREDARHVCCVCGIAESDACLWKGRRHCWRPCGLDSVAFEALFVFRFAAYLSMSALCAHVLCLSATMQTRTQGGWRVEACGETCGGFRTSAAYGHTCIWPAGNSLARHPWTFSHIRFWLCAPIPSQSSPLKCLPVLSGSLSSAFRLPLLLSLDAPLRRRGPKNDPPNADQNSPLKL